MQWTLIVQHTLQQENKSAKSKLPRHRMLLLERPEEAETDTVVFCDNIDH